MENMEFSKCNVLQKLTRDLEITTELVTITTTLQNTEDFEPEEFSVFGLLCICLFIFGILFGITYFVITSLITNIALIIGIPAFLSVVLSIAVFIAAGIILFKNLIKKNIPI